MCVLGGVFLGFAIHGIIAGSRYAITPDRVVGYLAGKICPQAEWIFNEIIMPILSYVVQIIIISGGLLGAVIASVTGYIVNALISEIIT
ncbi:MAG: hypothetical protein ACTSX9_06350 [Candidatus Njordarchaeales archaeon]